MKTGRKERRELTDGDEEGGGRLVIGGCWNVEE